MRSPPSVSVARLGMLASTWFAVCFFFHSFAVFVDFIGAAVFLGTFSGVSPQGYVSMSRVCVCVFSLPC